MHDSLLNDVQLEEFLVVGEVVAGVATYGLFCMNLLHMHMYMHRVSSNVELERVHESKLL